MLRIFQKNVPENTHYTLIKNDLQQTALALQDAYNNLENVVEPDLIDCYIYELNSVQMRYKFLLATIKKNGGGAVVKQFLLHIFLSVYKFGFQSYAKNPREPFTSLLTFTSLRP